MTNRLLRWFSHRIFVSFAETRRFFPKGKTVVTGNPIRREILACLPNKQAFLPFAYRSGLNGQGEKVKKKDRFTLSVFGGSAGAHRINEAMMDALEFLEEIKTSVRIIHQTGSADVDSVSKAYKERGFDATVRPFFKDIGAYYQSSDLVICRAGASTLSEMAVCGKAVLFIPYPYAAHNHQFINAQRLVDLGAARMIRDKELNGSLLAQTILHLYNHPEERARMETAVQQLARPNAAQEIVEHCYALVREK
jgi:UDP-N-acetylglucosamine--N-acetylmuramyl-(pentapeptide) pyrophosphoryl-undecaprenol N-acetylglucosamine transferase